MSEPSTKPYLIRAIYDWCADNGFTPFLAVQVDAYTQVPMSYVKDGRIVLNIGMDAVRNLQLGNEDIVCGGRFGGVAHQIIVPVNAVLGIFAKENGQGLVFQGTESAEISAEMTAVDGSASKPSNSIKPTGKPKLTVIK